MAQSEERKATSTHRHRDCSCTTCFKYIRTAHLSTLPGTRLSAVFPPKPISSIAPAPLRPQSFVQHMASRTTVLTWGEKYPTSLQSRLSAPPAPWLRAATKPLVPAQVAAWWVGTEGRRAVTDGELPPNKAVVCGEQQSSNASPPPRPCRALLHVPSPVPRLGSGAAAPESYRDSGQGACSHLPNTCRIFIFKPDEIVTDDLQLRGGSCTAGGVA